MELCQVAPYSSFYFPLLTLWVLMIFLLGHLDILEH